MTTINKNRDALYHYEILDTYEAGIELLGWEVSAAKNGRVTMKGGIVKNLGSELYLVNVHISPLEEHGSALDPLRSRKLLLHREEIGELLMAVQSKSMTIVPLRMYSTRGLIKVEIGLAKGRKRHEQNLARKRKAQEQKMRQEMKDLGV